MRLDRSELSKAVQTALSLGAVAAVGVAGTAFAQTATTTQTGQKKPQTLQTIVVTGSHIRRVDLETSNPVVTVSSQQIQQSGAVTVGDLIQQLPAVTGSPMNPRVNNGGGTGGAFADLRGLGTGRTLVLVDGHRVTNNDLNIIPTEMIERVEVLTDGGAVTYGSDAIGGVVNFILKKNYQGAQATFNYGISDRNDGQRQGTSFIFGQTSDKGSILAGVDYDKFDGISSANRDYSKNALYLYYGNVYAFGSSRNPFGREYLQTTDSSGATVTASTQGTYGCSSVTRKAPGAGTGQSLSDYRCFTGADTYNYQLKNLIITPQERTNAFFRGDYQLTDNVQAYMDVFHNNTTSAYAIAPLPFDALNDGVIISKDSMYNPFGIDFGPSTNNLTGNTNKDGSPAYAQYNFLTRWTGVGQRMGHYDTTTDQGIVGLRGSIGQTSWQWDANYNYGHISFNTKLLNDLIYNQAFKNTLGPSMIDPTTGNPICVSTPGDASTVIAGCTPLNIFDSSSANSVAIEKQFAADLFSNQVTIFRTYSVGANGTVFSLPAGDAQLAVGADYRKLYTHSIVDSLTVLDPATNTCQAPQSACTTALQGGYNVKEAYAELYIPILKDLPFVRSLNVDLGGRYSKYSLAGSTSNYKLAVEYRPIDDLLLRGTVQDVFRAPTISDLFLGQQGNAPPFLDPCINLSAAELAAHSAACQNVPAGATFQQLQGGLSQTTGIVSGSVAAGYNLQPEFGRSFDFGAVYSPHFVPGLTLQADLWRIYLNNAITLIDAQTAADICFSDNSSPFCALIHRRSSGQINYIAQPTVNIGRFDTRGFDVQAQYRIPQVAWLPGQFTVALQGTYLAQYDNNSAPGVAGAETFHLAGHFYKGFGSYPRVRGQLFLNWNDGPWDASWRFQYIGSETIGSADPSQNETADGAYPAYTIPVPQMVYSYAQVGYTIQPINTHISVGVDNVFDKQPPLFYQTSVINANTDVNTYDTVGRFYFAKATVKF
jgi:outer membrane receptor protein involved in Fe transport